MKKNLLDDHRALWKSAFPADSEAFLDIYFTQKAHESNTLSRYIKGELAAACQVIRLELKGAGRTLRGGYISGLTTQPQHRKKGLAADILKEAHAQLLNEGADFCLLIPGDEHLRQFYTDEARGAYATCSYRKQTTRLLTALKAQTLYEIKEERSDAAWLYPFYTAKNKQEPCALQLLPNDFYAALSTYKLEGGKIFSAWQNNAPIGYLIAIAQGETCLLREAPSMSGKAFDTLAAHACNIFNCQHIRYPEFSATPKANFSPYAMVKLLNSNPLKPSEEGRKDLANRQSVEAFFNKNALQLWHLIDE